MPPPPSPQEVDRLAVLQSTPGEGRLDMTAARWTACTLWRVQRQSGKSCLGCDACTQPPMNARSSVIPPSMGVPVRRNRNFARSAHAAGIDPIQNLVYLGGLQYPTDPAVTTTGVSGIQVFWDSTPLAQPLTMFTKATLASIGSATATGSIVTSPMGRSIRMDVALKGVSGLAAVVNVTTTIGNEAMECSLNATALTATCGGAMIGDPLIGGVVLASVDGVPVPKGTITVGP